MYDTSESFVGRSGWLRSTLSQGMVPLIIYSRKSKYESSHLDLTVWGVKKVAVLKQLNAWMELKNNML